MTFSRPERSLLAFLAFIQFSHIVDFMVLMPLGPQLMRLFHLSPHEFGLLVSIYTLAAGMSALIGASIIDRYDRKRALQILYLGFSIGTIGCSFAPTYHWLLALRGITGLFGGVLSSLVFAIIGDVISFDRRGRAMSIIMMAFSLASVVGVPFALLLANRFTWHTPFFFLGMLSLLVSLLIPFFIPSLRGHILSSERPTSVLLPFRRAVTNKNQFRALFLISFLVIGHFSVIPFISPSFVANVGYTEHDLAYIYIVGGLVTIVSGPLVGKAVDRFGVREVFKFFVLFSLVPLYLITNLSVVPMWMSLMIVSVFFICIGGRMIPAQTLMTSTVHPEERGGFMSISNAIQQTSAAIASYVAGIIVAKGSCGELLNYPLVGYIGMAFSVGAVIVSRGVDPITVDRDLSLHD